MPNSRERDKIVTKSHANRSEHYCVDSNHNPAFLGVVVGGIAHLISPSVLNLNISHTMRTVNGL